jgi:predicted MFS family arabinose efflux permease
MVLPFLSIYLKEELELDLEQVSIILAMFGAGSLVGSLIGGRLTDMIGAYKVQLGSLIISGFGFFLLERLTAFMDIAIGFFFITVVTDSFRPANATAIAQYAKPENLTRAYSLNRMAVNLGYSIGPALGGFIAAVDFSLLFYADGLSCIAAGIVFAAYFLPLSRKNPHPKPDLNLPKKLSPYRDRSYLLTAVLTVLFALVFFQLFNTLPIFYKDVYSLPESSIGILMALNGFVVFLLEMPLVAWFGRKYSLKSIVVAGCLAVGLSYLILNWHHSFTILIISMIVLSVSEILVMPFLATYTSNRAEPRSRGAYMGLYSMSYATAFILAPLIGFFLVDFSGYVGLWWAMFLIAVFAAIAFSINLSNKGDENPEVPKI